MSSENSEVTEQFQSDVFGYCEQRKLNFSFAMIESMFFVIFPTLAHQTSFLNFHFKF